MVSFSNSGFLSILCPSVEVIKNTSYQWQYFFSVSPLHDPAIYEPRIIVVSSLVC